MTGDLPAYLPPRLRRIRQMRSSSRSRNAIMQSSTINQPALVILCSTGAASQQATSSVG